MKTFKKNTFFIALLVIVLAACNQEEDLSPGSNLPVAAADLSELDQWIRDNFTDPYNIEVVYKWQESLVDQGRFLYPPHIDSVRPAMEVIKALWIEPYNQVADAPFVQALAPRQIVLVGGLNVNPSGTITLGLADAGRRVTLFNIDLLDKSSRFSLNQFISTIQHEYAHILNQSRPFNEEVYGQITPEGYTAQWFNETDRGSREEGFISAYARANESEDFAEMVSEMLSRSRSEWNTLVNNIRSDEAWVAIREKERIVATYYNVEYNLDIYELQDSAYNATIRLVN